ncbi:uncharacterized protein LOC141902058 isoform X2 [Tubulanus polymorphus]|uniref:uncharacterized protein LOC141902058 isoform X2 n=1 Tax=Tubulanus polymorphus TaxID=672921 RepID=UPI003DA1E5E5
MEKLEIPEICALQLKKKWNLKWIVMHLIQIWKWIFRKKKNTRLGELDLSDNGIGQEGVTKIALMIHENQFITRLDLSNNQLSNEGAKILGQMLQENRVLTYLNLSGNNFQESDATFIATGIEFNERLVELDVSHNNFSEDGAMHIGKALGTNPLLKKLNLGWNHIRRKGAVTICKGLVKNDTLTEINLSWNGFGYEGALALGQALKRNKCLISLDISNNRINWQGAVFISSGLQVNPTLETLRIGTNPLTTTGCMDIINAISHEESAISYLDLTDVPVVGEFEIMAQMLQRSRNLTYIHGGVVSNHDILGRRLEAAVDPLQQVINYMQNNSLRPMELFRSFDKQVIFRIGESNFMDRLQRSGINLKKGEIEQVVGRVDKAEKDQHGISYSKLVNALKEQKLKQRQNKKKEIKEKQKLKEYHMRILNPDGEDISESDTTKNDKNDPNENGFNDLDWKSSFSLKSVSFASMAASRASFSGPATTTEKPSKKLQQQPRRQSDSFSFNKKR